MRVGNSQQLKDDRGVVIDGNGQVVTESRDMKLKVVLAVLIGGIFVHRRS